MAETPTPVPAAPELRWIDQETITYVSKNLRGINTALVRFYEADRGFEDEFIALMLALGVSTDSTKIERIAPSPRRRFSFQFAGTKATITVAPAMPLLG